MDPAFFEAITRTERLEITSIEFIINVEIPRDFIQ